MGVVFVGDAGDGCPMKPTVIQVLGAELTGQSHLAARRLIDDYFARITWSLEKEEWEKMSETQKIEFVRKARVNSNN